MSRSSGSVRIHTIIIKAIPRALLSRGACRCKDVTEQRASPPNPLLSAGRAVPTVPTVLDVEQLRKAPGKKRTLKKCS